MPSQVTDCPDPSAFPSTSAHQPGQASTSAQPGYASTSTTLAAEASTSANLEEQGFSPSALHPFPKAGARKNPGRKRKKLQSEVLTDAPVKQAREEERKKISSAKKKIKYQGQKKKMTSKKKAANKRPKPDDTEDADSSDDENVCIVCLEHFDNSQPREVWIRCQHCRFWAHEACTPGKDNYICHNCLSN